MPPPVTVGVRLLPYSRWLIDSANKKMKHSDFYIGMEFFTAAGKWRCTDIGSRVVVAISLEPREMVRVHYDENKEHHEERFSSSDPRDLSGPPYGVVEHVFDEYDLEACYARPEEASN